jgi:hypothetical protein
MYHSQRIESSAVELELYLHGLLGLLDKMKSISLTSKHVTRLESVMRDAGHVSLRGDVLSTDSFQFIRELRNSRHVEGSQHVAFRNELTAITSLGS